MFPDKCRIIGNCCLLVCDCVCAFVHFCASDWIIHFNHKNVFTILQKFLLRSFIFSLCLSISHIFCICLLLCFIKAISDSYWVKYLNATCHIFMAAMLHQTKWKCLVIVIQPGALTSDTFKLTSTSVGFNKCCLHIFKMIQQIQTHCTPQPSLLHLTEAFVSPSQPLETHN